MPALVVVVNTVPPITVVATRFRVFTLCSPFTLIRRQLVTDSVTVGVRLTMSPSLLLCSMLDVRFRLTRRTVVRVVRLDVLESVSRPPSRLVNRMTLPAPLNVSFVTAFNREISFTALTKPLWECRVDRQTTALNRRAARRLLPTWLSWVWAEIKSLERLMVSPSFRTSRQEVVSCPIVSVRVLVEDAVVPRPLESLPASPDVPLVVLVRLWTVVVLPLIVVRALWVPLARTLARAFSVLIPKCRCLPRALSRPHVVAFVLLVVCTVLSRRVSVLKVVAVPVEVSLASCSVDLQSPSRCRVVAAVEVVPPVIATHLVSGPEVRLLRTNSERTLVIALSSSYSLGPPQVSPYRM